jgi:hypothetical protein
MRLYHGTSERWLEDILRRGIIPRGEAGEGNWDEFPSRPDMVYLTTAYPLYFAASMATEGDRLVVLETELDELAEGRLFPDEDVIAQSISHFQLRPLKQVQHEVVDNLEAWQDKWLDALEAMGTVAYQGVVGTGRIQRVALIDVKARETPALFFKMMDPSISILNFKVMGDYYIQLTEWVMGHRETLPVGMEMEVFKQMDLEMYQAKLALHEAESVDRSGIELWDKEKWAQKVNGIRSL